MFLRVQEPEAMDDPSLERKWHAQALTGLARINYFSRSGQTLWSAIRTLSKKPGKNFFRVLDIATGAGDVPIFLWKKARSEGLRLEIDACDKSPQALAHAQTLAKNISVRFFALDIDRESIPSGYDIIACSLFLHHLKNKEAVDFLKRIGQAAERLIVINDLERSVAGLALAYTAPRLLTASSIVHEDSVKSVRAAFTRQEALRMAEEAGLAGAKIRPVWPARFLLTWER